MINSLLTRLREGKGNGIIEMSDVIFSSIRFFGFALVATSVVMSFFRCLHPILQIDANFSLFAIASFFVGTLFCFDMRPVTD